MTYRPIYSSEHHPDGGRGLIWLFLIVVLGMIYLCSCNAENHFKKQAAKHPEWLNKRDSVVVKHDTITTKEVHKDSTISNIYSKDTVFVKQNNLIVKYVYKGGDSAYIAGIMKPYKIPHKDSTVYVTNTVIREVKEPKTAWENFCDIAVILTLIVVVGKYIGIPIVKALWPKLPF